MSTTTLHSLCQDAREDMMTRLWDDPTMTDHEREDVANEVAAAWVPVYNATLLEVAASDVLVAVDTPDMGPGDTPLDTISRNIYEALRQACAEAIRDWHEERDEWLDDAYAYAQAALQELSGNYPHITFDMDGAEIDDYGNATVEVRFTVQREED